jgi:hypothetical protein
MCLHHEFYDSKSSCDTRVFVYVFIHVMCLCVYVSMVCQQCMLYDDMYSHNNARTDILLVLEHYHTSIS